MISTDSALRIFCIEDNPLLVMHLQVLIEDSGHVFAGSAARFDDVREKFPEVAFDLALIDIDLADGRTGGDIAEWLDAHGRPSVFITGQEEIAAEYAHASLGMIIKPIDEEQLAEMLWRVAASERGDSKP